MKKIGITVALVAGLALAGLAPTVLAGHGNTLSDQQNVVFANPLTVGLRPDCTTSVPTEGTPAADAHWYDVEEFQEHTFRIQVDSTLDIDPFFYNANDKDPNTGACWSMTGGHPYVAGLGGLGAWELGAVPWNATHLAVDHFSGAGQYTLEIPNPACANSPNCPPPVLS